MRALTASALLCALTALTRAAALLEAKPEGDQTAKSHLVKRAASCFSGWTKFNDRCFRYIPKAMTWVKAEKNCQSLGGNLASVHNVMEYQELQRLIMSASYEYKETWIGGSDAQEENMWFWSDGTSFNYQEWCAGEPNNHSGNQHCLRMNHGGQKCWDDYQCLVKKPSVCAKM